MSKTAQHPRSDLEASLWREFQFRVRDNSLEALEWLQKKPGTVPEDGWYVKHVRPATAQEKQLYDFLMRGPIKLVGKDDG